MKNLLNRSIIMSLFILVFLSIKVNSVFAVDSDFKVDANGVLTEYTGSSIYITIPDSVTSIGDHVFYGNKDIVSVTIPDSVTSIGDYAFSYCHRLVTVDIPNSVTNIGENAFVFCESLTNVKIPNSITNLKPFVFGGCYSLTGLNIPDSVTTIEENALAFNKFVSINIPASVRSIHSTAFVGCQKLEKISVSTSNPNYKDVDGILFNKNGTELVAYPIGKSDTEYTIPDSVTTIDTSAFEKCINLTKINIPNSITNISDYVFKDCTNLISINIPDSVISIGKLAFGGCDRLTSVFIYNKNIEFGNRVFGSPSQFITLYGYKDSTTETYASQNGYKFQDLENQDKQLVSISLAKTNINLAVGKSTLNHVIYNPDDTTDDKTVKWSSSDTSIARVLTNGKIQAISKGNAVITAKVGDLTATCNITVN